MRWAGRSVAAALVAAVAVLAPVAASPAAAKWEDPIEPVHDLPSNWRGAGSGGVLDPDDAIIRKYEIDLSRDIRAPKPVNMTLAKGIGVLGIAQAVALAFGVSSELGVSIYAVMSGSTIDEARCDMPDWYNGSVGVLSLGAMGSCNLQYVDPNVGVEVGSAADLGPYGVFRVRNNGVQNYFCGPTNSSILPSGYLYARTMSTGSEGGMSWVTNSTFRSVCGTGSGGAFGAWDSADLVSVRVLAPGGAVVASANVVTSTADPERRTRCQVDMADGSTVSSAWVTYTEGTGFPSAALDAACSTATAGLNPADMRTIGIETEDHLGVRERSVEVDVPAEHDPDAGRKSLILYKVLPTGDLLPCFSNPADCGEWFEESFGEDGDPNNYRCEYGEEYVNLDECIVYRHSFKPGNLGTITDPETGETIDWGRQPINTIHPGTGPGTSPGTVCMAQWGLVANPIEWVLQPVKCALVWAFVPRQTVVQEHVTGIGESVGEVGSVEPLLTLINALPSSSGCSGIPITLTFFGQEAHGTLLAACDGEAAAAAAVVNGLLTLALVTAAFLAITRYAAAVFGFVGPGGAFEQTARHTENVTAQSRGKGS